MNSNRTLTLLGGVLLLGLAFISGYVARDFVEVRHDGIEDYALTNILNELAYRQLINERRYDEIRMISDVNIDAHLTRLRKVSDSIVEPTLSATRNRTLAKVADLWEREPPFQNAQFRGSAENDWLPEWRREHQENLALILAAKTAERKTKEK